ncbi:MAG: HDOD domain-containing protein [Desulfarculus sp.]|nr:HDOD domain-containing protein [Desulfarculus sp.]
MPVAIVEHQRIEGLPAPPSLLSALLQALDDESTSASDLERLVCQDQATTARLLAVANSSYYGSRHQVTSVARAVVVLGLNEVRAICLGSVLTSLLHPNRFADPGSAQALWRHSLVVSEAARLIASRGKRLRPDLAQTAGLLHDLGWVLIMVFQPEAWLQVRARQKGQVQSLVETARRLGLDHQQSGYILARQWDLPPVLTSCLGRHHEPSLSDPDFPCVATVHLAEILAGRLDDPGWGEDAVGEPAIWVLKGLGVSVEQWRDCQTEMAARMDALMALGDQLLGGVA